VLYDTARYILAAAAIVSSASGDFPVNVRTSLNQANPAIAADSNGNFVVVWQSYYSGKSNEIMGRLFSKEGEVLNDEFKINQAEEGNQKNAAVAMDGKGSFVAAWRSEDLNDEFWIFARRFDANGVGLNEFRVSDEPNGRSPAVALRDDGSFVIVWEWQEYWDPFEVRSIMFRLYDANDIPAASGNVNLLYDCRNPDVGMDEDGEFVVVWMQDDIYHSSNVIMARRYNNDGSAKGDPFEVSVTGFETIATAAVSVNGDGDFVVTWDGADYNEYNQIYSRKYGADGYAVTDEFVVNSMISAENENPECSINDLGDFVIMWDRQTAQAEMGKDVLGQRYDIGGGRVGDEFKINTYVYDDQQNVAVSCRTDGTFVGVWQSEGQDGSDGGIFGRIGPLTGTADLNGDGFVDFADYSQLSAEWKQQGSGLAANLINDNKVDLEDIAAFCEQWLTYRHPCEQADISGEGGINLKDFSILAADWKNYGPSDGDIDGNGTVDEYDLQWLTLHWVTNCQ
jgi:hypothetical protein